MPGTQELREKTPFYKYTPILRSKWNYQLRFRKKPLQTLLLICDVLQQWGRESNEDGEIKYNLKEIKIINNNIEYKIEASWANSSNNKIPCLEIKKFVRDLEGIRNLTSHRCLNFECLHDNNFCINRCWDRLMEETGNKFTIKIKLNYNSL